VAVVHLDELRLHTAAQRDGRRCGPKAPAMSASARNDRGASGRPRARPRPPVFKTRTGSRGEGRVACGRNGAGRRRPTSSAALSAHGQSPPSSSALCSATVPPPSARALARPPPSRAPATGGERARAGGAHTQVDGRGQTPNHAAPTPPRHPSRSASQKPRTHNQFRGAIRFAQSRARDSKPTPRF
jgi:hypothetical protein